jgi:DNA-binding GntR family transcriptional regulator
LIRQSDKNSMSVPALTYPQQAYEYVRNGILNLTYKPGEYLSDSHIAAELSISRTPVREAFHRLEHEGFLINEARRGWRVYSLSLEDIQDIFDLKEAIEGMLARKAAACADEELRQALRDACEQMVVAAEKGDSDAWFENDVRLHRLIQTMAANERAERLVATLNDQWHRVRIGFIAMQARMERSASEHQAFVDAILAGDGEAAEQQMRSHLRGVRDDLERLLVNIVLPFAQNGV